MLRTGHVEFDRRGHLSGGKGRTKEKMLSNCIMVG